MASAMTCPACRAPIDVTSRQIGETVACPKCGQQAVVERPTALLDAAQAQDIITRARERTKAQQRTIECPNCATAMPLTEEQGRAGASFRCMECGQKIVMAQKPGAAKSDSVTFPTFGVDGTLLDMGDTRGNFKKPPEKP